MKAPKCVALRGFWYLSKCLPSPVGMLSLTASEPIQSVCSTADSKGSFVTTHSSKTSKDCPVGFADFGSVSLVCLQFSVGFGIFVCMSCWSHDLTLQIVELKAWRRQLSVTEPHAAHFESDHRATMLTGCWLTPDRTPESFLRTWCGGELNVYMPDLDTPHTCVYLVVCCLRPPG